MYVLYTYFFHTTISRFQFERLTRDVTYIGYMMHTIFLIELVHLTAIITGPGNLLKIIVLTYIFYKKYTILVICVYQKLTGFEKSKGLGDS